MLFDAGAIDRQQHEELKPLLQAPIKLADVSLAGYAGIFIPGGHGAMVNLHDSPDLGKLLLAAHTAGTPTIALCHGPAALLSASKVEGAEFPYKVISIDHAAA